MGCSSFISPRRFYLSKRIVARLLGEHALSSNWWHQQDQQPHTVLPDGFPSKAALAIAGYTASEDLEGADESELVEWACISNSAARAVLAAYAAL